MVGQKDVNLPTAPPSYQNIRSHHDSVYRRTGLAAMILRRSQTILFATRRTNPDTLFVKSRTNSDLRGHVKRNNDVFIKCSGGFTHSGR
jgi:hypothetical protein